jgi:hypothetical protein
MLDAIRTLAENASNMPSTVRGTPPPVAPHSSTPYLPVACNAWVIRGSDVQKTSAMEAVNTGCGRP